MKRIHRLSLSSKTIDFLSGRAARVAASPDPRTEARRLWKMKANKAFREIREALERMASGIERCMYCEGSEGTAIEHFWPKSVYPDRAFDWLNYLIACTRCNSNFKRDQFPLDGAGDPLLVNPTEEDPLDHLSFSLSTGWFTAKSPKGQPSIDVFGLNRANLIKGRGDAWTSLKHLLVSYDAMMTRGEDEEAERIEMAIRHQPFAGVFAALLWIASGPNAELLIDDVECLQVIQSRHEIGTWT